MGDYCVEFKNGYVPNIVFERKGVGDLYGTMGKGYKRFKKEIERAKESDTQLILIIEGSLSKVLKGYKYSRIKGVSLIKKLFTLWFRYGLLPVFCKDRVEMGEYIIQYYSAIGREGVRESRSPNGDKNSAKNKGGVNCGGA